MMRFIFVAFVSLSFFAGTAALAAEKDTKDKVVVEKETICRPCVYLGCHPRDNEKIKAFKTESLRTYLNEMKGTSCHSAEKRCQRELTICESYAKAPFEEVPNTMLCGEEDSQSIIEAKIKWAQDIIAANKAANSTEHVKTDEEKIFDCKQFLSAAKALGNK